MVVDKIELILNDEATERDTAVVKKIVEGKYQSALDKDFPEITYVEDTAGYTILSKKIEMMLKLYNRCDNGEKEILISTLSKTFDHDLEYYHDINYFAFTVLFLTGKNEALTKLETAFVIDSAFVSTISVLGLILIFKHDEFDETNINDIKAFLGKIKKLIDPLKPPDFKRPYGLKLDSEDDLQIFVKDSHSYIKLLRDSIIPRIMKTIHKIDYNRLGKYLEGINREINSDRITLIDRMDDLGFSDDAKQCLNEIDRIYYGSPDKFQCKNCMDLIRALFSEIFGKLVQGLIDLSGIIYEGEEDKFAHQNQYLRKVDFINDSELDLFQKYYGFVSNVGTHRLTSEREYVRISRNIAIELGLLLLNRYNEKLQRQG